MNQMSIFRPQALKHYMAERRKDILPRYMTLPAFASLWILIVAAGVAIVVSCQITIPLYADKEGQVLSTTSSASERNEMTTVLLIFPLNQLAALQHEKIVQLQMDARNTTWERSTLIGEPLVLSSQQAQKRSHLEGSDTLVIPQQSVAVLVTLKQSGHVPVGKKLSVRVQVGQQSLLSLFSLKVH